MLPMVPDSESILDVNPLTADADDLEKSMIPLLMALEGFGHRSVHVSRGVSVLTELSYHDRVIPACPIGGEAC